MNATAECICHKPRVLNKHHSNNHSHAVYIGRGSKWGNPFVIGKDGTREECVAKFRMHVNKNPELIEMAKKELKGKDLLCFCAPRACHGDVLLEIANGEQDE